MPRTNSRKRNNLRSDNTTRVSTVSNLSPNAPEFIPIANDENQRVNITTQPMDLCESSNTPSSSGSNSNTYSSETTNTVVSISDGSNKSQRDLLINLLNNCKVDCVICYERAQNIEPIWNCRNCFQIMHLRCIMVWFIKSHKHGAWRCPACQNNVVGKPDYLCFCGTLKNPCTNQVDIPHSCGQICGLIKKNLNVEYTNCHHKCTLLCHPGPCPQCVVQVLRKCSCGKTEVYVQCGLPTPVLCQNICSKELNCKNHVCEKKCHVGQCGTCKKLCPQNVDTMETNNEINRTRHLLNRNFNFGEYMVSAEELQILAITPEELRILAISPEELFQNNEINENDDYENNDTMDSNNTTDYERFWQAISPHNLIQQSLFRPHPLGDDGPYPNFNLRIEFQNEDNFETRSSSSSNNYSTDGHESYSSSDEEIFPFPGSSSSSSSLSSSSNSLSSDNSSSSVSSPSYWDENDGNTSRNISSSEESSRNSICYCGKSQRQVPCTQENSMVVYYNCGKPCEKKLQCNNHLCQTPCHIGQCEPCKLLDVDSCPCGKRPFTQDELNNRTSCNQPIPTCGQPCGKSLECGPLGDRHVCEKNCHEGPCGRCELKIKCKCKCGSSSKELKCYSVAGTFTCRKKCNKKMSCGNHKCMVVCCDAQTHECFRICNRLLNCRQHRCDRICHAGSCGVCQETSSDPLFCRCGNSYIPPPIRCGTRLPSCTLPCSREHECGHPATHICHDETECPPCISLTEKLCFGGHELRFAIPCNIKNVSCGMPCGNPLPCKRHTCTKPCHPPPCNTGPCQLQCNLPKSDCGHPCSRPCHDGPCPQSACRLMVSVSCVCGNLTEARVCSDPKVIEYRLKIRTQSMSLLDNIVDSSQTIKSYKILECTTECAKIERNRRIALALQIRNPDLSPNVTPRYSDFMKEFAKRDAPFCNYIHEKLAELVTNAKQSKQNSRSHSFEVMKYEKRKLVHEYCEHFGCESVAYDAEPNRNVCAIANKEKSWLPNYSVVEVVQRESGCPRVNPFASIQKRNTVILNKKN